jgi:hypothetical protein
MDSMARRLAEEKAGTSPQTQPELQPVIGSWAMASADADNGQRGIAVSVVPLNAEPFVIIFPENTMVDFSKHFRDAIHFVRAGKKGPVHPPAIVTNVEVQQPN